MQVTTIDGLEAFLNLVARLKERGPHCFRGQASVRWNLTPSLYRSLHSLGRSPIRGEDAEALGRIERDTYRQFHIRARRFMPTDLRSRWEELAIAQHHGTPTRLLDWSMSPLVALYFAVAEHGADDAALWALNLAAYPFHEKLGRPQMTGAHRIENLQKFFDGRVPPMFEDVSTPADSVRHRAGAQPENSSVVSGQECLAVFEAPSAVPRLAAQQGVFSVFLATTSASITDHDSEILRVEAETGLDLLTRIDIPSASISQLQERLPIQADAIFPDLEGVALALQKQSRIALRLFLGSRS